jgi:predicted TIM-barrel fold metal-dependent hydrolase
MNPMNLKDLVAIDIHTHAEKSAWMPPDEQAREMDEAKGRYFKYAVTHPTIDEMAAYYRERKIAFVVFPVDSEAGTGQRRVTNEEVAESAAKHKDICIPFASIDPHRGKMGAREARRLVKEFGIRGFKFHPSVQEFFPNDRMAYPLYEAIAETRLPTVFHTGQTGIGAGMRGGGGIRLKYSNPIYLDDVAVDFPDMPIIMAHPSIPWQDEALSVATHKPQVYIDLSGWSPKYFPPRLVQHANSILKHKVLFGSDYPVLTPDRWLKDFQDAGFKPEVRQLILKDNAAKLLGLA